jgi:hypothetical protein
MESIKLQADFSGSFGDKRIEDRASAMLSKLTTGRSSSIHRISGSAAERKAFYRLLDNERFSEENIEKSIVKRCGELCGGRHVLCIQDSSEINLESHRGRIKAGSGVGRTTKEGILGFFLHPCLVIDAEQETALGYSYIDVWHRDENGKDRHERGYTKQPIEEKESYKWIAVTEQSKRDLSRARQITIIADREADIYDMFGRYTGDDKVKLLIRSNSNRQINKSKEKIIEHLAGQPVKHRHTITVYGDVRKGVTRRKAELEVKWSVVELCRPDSCNDVSIKKSAEVTVIEAKEKGKDGICWRLYTTHAIVTAEDALQIIEWYTQRWYIEQVFRLLKMQGFAIEGSQLESGWAIRKLLMLALLAVLRIMQMLVAYEDEGEQPINEVFNEEEQQCLGQVNKTMEGGTEKLTNPYSSKTLKWATWIIARLGGWKGYTSQRKPGPILLHRGLTKFYQLFEGWLLARNFLKDVGTQ